MAVSLNQLLIVRFKTTDWVDVGFWARQKDGGEESRSDGLTKDIGKRKGWTINRTRRDIRWRGYSQKGSHEN